MGATTVKPWSDATRQRERSVKATTDKRKESSAMATEVRWV
jgi:hypothetical protein